MLPTRKKRSCRSRSHLSCPLQLQDGGTDKLSNEASSQEPIKITCNCRTYRCAELLINVVWLSVDWILSLIISLQIEMPTNKIKYIEHKIMFFVINCCSLLRTKVPKHQPFKRIFIKMESLRGGTQNHKEVFYKMYG